MTRRRVGSAGNAAGTGAHIALLNKGARHEIERLVTRIEKIETALDASFQEHFVAAMAIPHQSAPYPNLARAVELPPAPEAEGPGPAFAEPTTARRLRSHLSVTASVV